MRWQSSRLKRGFRPPASQAQHLCHIVRRLDHMAPWITPRPAFRDRPSFIPLSARLSKEGQFLVAPRGQFSMARDKLLPQHPESWAAAKP
jgi:hypothetical protein